ncbi:hypothetical protein GLOIN_2v1703051 [Rhizophagus irregularis DAOM 181602=DAOM 197198]|uniref:Uncharacterized protein n=1 Tax=Rhizophagus irregularis (strain DAOM 181602 / DAOM 197198 / MUCL 43194) TaxID=747089 RepID=A0A2P4P881_RHIID|nr:hypothetical protein GLOIN_2v1703051 [Rhizophagus irregularis DAOM 181602=DAOM 197198]POG61596.1 hypothetical protein GLOIN_2v1703051 [Rhizophagus irregularis DAOM 181602=DAOM 197198]GET62809.1 hypothetical protein GLOIN_2v1703051 [Rhizophagus irregularis DAOM 181602=DAOM 197198]|eukprot:XP_025168462.1 hypothetical protein GLOIN_2v1703051 [Rhizophagus irregularis DAOM 181602=DAOM 197198]
MITLITLIYINFSLFKLRLLPLLRSYLNFIILITNHLHPYYIHSFDISKFKPYYVFYPNYIYYPYPLLLLLYSLSSSIFFFFL